MTGPVELEYRYANLPYFVEPQLVNGKPLRAEQHQIESFEAGARGRRVTIFPAEGLPTTFNVIHEIAKGRNRQEEVSATITLPAVENLQNDDPDLPPVSPVIELNDGTLVFLREGDHFNLLLGVNVFVR